MVTIDRLQSYLRQSARRQYQVVPAPPFTLFFHTDDPLRYFNYAIPDEPVAGDVREPLAVLRAAFAARNRHPRVEFVEAFAPELAAALRAAGFTEEARQPLMICTPESYRPAPLVPGLTIITLNGGSSLDEAQAFVTTQNQGFDPTETRAATEREARRFLQSLRGSMAFLALLDGQAAGAGMFSVPLDGITEVAGIATRLPFRRRGVASALTAQAVHTAFRQGVRVVCLTAADERAGHVYERVGFRPYATMLAYADAP